MKKIVLSITFTLLLIVLIGCKKEFVIEEDHLDYQLTDDQFRVYYEIYLGSYSDSNDDGIGDLNGLIERLDYLNDGDPQSGKSLGVEGIWLMPVMKSPSYHKYDVADYMSIDSDYGTIEDFKRLTEEADKRGIKVIIDFVLNHTSIYHQWFKKAKEAVVNEDFDDPYFEYYTLVTQEQKVSGRTYYPFAGDYYYEGNFSSQMPELNMDSEFVKAEIIEILQFWYDLGVHGFRLDATKYVYFNEHAKNIAFWNWFVSEAKKIKPDTYIVGETWSGDSLIAPYYESFSNFDFGMAQFEGAIAMTANANDSVNNYVKYLDSYRQMIENVREGSILQPFISNHDMNRAAGFLSVDDYRMQMAANLYLLTYGAPFMYYGEEIGMKGSRGSENTDANRRLKMLWGDKDSVDSPPGATYDISKQTNGTVKDQLKDELSLYNHYKKVIMLRNANPEIARGSYTPLYFKDIYTFGGFISTYQNKQVGVFHNTGEAVLEIDLSNYTDIDFKMIRGYVGKGVARIENGILIIDGLTSVVLR